MSTTERGSDKQTRCFGTLEGMSSAALSTASRASRREVKRCLQRFCALLSATGRGGAVCNTSIVQCSAPNLNTLTGTYGLNVQRAADGTRSAAFSVFLSRLELEVKDERVCLAVTGNVTSVTSVT